MNVLAAVAFALAAAATLVVTALVSRRMMLARREHRRLRSEERLRPIAIALLEGESEPGDMSEQDAEVLAGIMGRYARSLTGESGAHIGSFFERNGFVSRELAALSDRRGWRRATAAYTLGNMITRAAVPALVATLSDPEREVRAAATLSLGKLEAEEAVEPLVEALAKEAVPRSVAAQTLLMIGPEAVPRLIAQARDSDPDVRAAAIELVGLLGGPDDGAFLVAGLRDPAAEVRAKSARALGRLGAAEGATALRAALDDRIAFVRTAAAIALGAIGGAEAAPALLEQARRDQFDAARAAAQSLARVDPEALRAAARDREAGPHVCEAADMLAAGAI